MHYVVPTYIPTYLYHACTLPEYQTRFCLHCVLHTRIKDAERKRERMIEKERERERSALIADKLGGRDVPENHTDYIYIHIYYI